ncbi:MAG: TIGR02265 family protein [Myxococcaceae bacterium]
MDTIEQLRRRRTQVREDDQMNGMGLESICRVVARQLGPDELQQLKELPFFPKRVVTVFRYPMGVFLDVAVAAIDRLAKKGIGYEAAMRSFGEASVEIFLENAMGKTMVALNGGNAQRMLSAGGMAFRAVYTFGERKYEKLAEREGIFRFDQDWAGPALQTGVLTRGLKISVRVDTTIKLVEPNPDMSRFALQLKW